LRSSALPYHAARWRGVFSPTRLEKRRYNLYWTRGDWRYEPMTTSVKGEYALQAIFDLACQRAGEPIKIADIARRQKIPQKFLELILAGLKQGGFVESRRGAEGGYLLARPASAITIGEVLRFVDGAQQQGKGRPRRKADTPFSEMWRQVDAAISDIIDKTTFAELIRQWTEKQNRFVPNWEI
jgi:Rrf2 family transcriptional regulator, cysteine metabolism repressor